MKLTKRGEYALRTLIQLGIAQKLEQGVLSVSTLAEREHLPFKFLEAILFELRGAGYVESTRGKLGGTRLAKPMKQIKMGEVVRLIDGKLAPIGCASETEYEPCTCPDEEHCGLRMVMIDVRNAIANILDRYTVAQVVELGQAPGKLLELELLDHQYKGMQVEMATAVAVTGPAAAAVLDK
jgi:Rrf2 family protein